MTEYSMIGPTPSLDDQRRRRTAWQVSRAHELLGLMNDEAIVAEQDQARAGHRLQIEFTGTALRISLRSALLSRVIIERLGARVVWRAEGLMKTRHPTERAIEVGDTRLGEPLDRTEAARLVSEWIREAIQALHDS